MQRPALLWLAVTVAAASLVLPASTRGAEEAPGPACEPGPMCEAPADYQSDAGQELADRYAPIVYLQKQKSSCDGREYPPIDVGMLFDVPGNVMRQDISSRPVVFEEPSAADFFEGGSDLYLDLPGDPIRPGCTYERNFREQSQGFANVAYAHIVTQEGREGIALQYWMFYYFNDWNNNHEGDWEMIQLIFEAETVEEALGEDPVRVGYSQHGGGERADWGDDKLTLEDGRPVSYVAAGAGANMFTPRNYLGRAEEPGVGLGCDDATPPHTRVPLEARLMNPDPQTADDEYAWLTFEGRWGELSRLESFRGPTGPNMKFAWESPFSWEEERLRDNNFSVPSGRTAGPGVVNAFCGTLEFASRTFLAVFYAWPILLPVTLGLLVVGAVVTVRRTSFAYVGPSLRERRRFGQVLRTSWRVYWTHPLTFLGLALVTLPVGIAAAAIHGFITSNFPVENILSVADTPRMLELILAVAFGSVVLEVAYFVVLCGVTAALAEMDDGLAPTVRSAARRAWEKAGGLAWARIKASVILTLLTISLVGIPWAIQRGTRWAFLEQAQLFDDATAAEAPGRSSEVVKGHWLSTFLRVGAILLIGIAAAPLLAVPLLFFVRVPLSTVNLVSSLLYIGLMPYVSIAFALLYLNLAAKSVPGSEPEAPSASPDSAPEKP